MLLKGKEQNLFVRQSKSFPEFVPLRFPSLAERGSHDKRKRFQPCHNCSYSSVMLKTNPSAISKQSQQMIKKLPEIIQKADYITVEIITEWD